jgi:hypothetical protein
MNRDRPVAEWADRVSVAVLEDRARGDDAFEVVALSDLVGLEARAQALVDPGEWV